MIPSNSPTTEILRPIVTGWLSKIELAQKHKKAFNDVSEQCMAFFSGSVGFMWDSKFQSKFLRGKLNPKFRMTMAKAFELVALFGPVLYWKNPTRRVMPRKPVEINPQLYAQFGDMGQQMFQQSMQEIQQKQATDAARAQLMELYLNYTPTEQPGDGLAGHAEAAITEALVKGRGVLWVEPYQMPGSERTLTGCFYDTVDNLLIDPDAENIDDAKWIAKRCVGPIWEVEREYMKYGHKPGFLKSKGNMESAESQGERKGDDMSALHRAQGQTFDMIVYYKVWSRGGVGARLTGVKTDLKDAFDRVVGDNAYIVVTQDVPYPLNMPSETLLGADDSKIKENLSWPVPYWMDERWPMVCLDFYRKPRSAWPIAPMAPGLGELTFMNVLVSHLANRIWSSSRDLIAVLKSAASEVKDKLQSAEDQTVFELNDVHDDIRKVVQFLQQPATNLDAWQILDRIAEIFDKRVGLSELHYAMNAGGVASRSAQDAGNKREMASVRPDYMAGKVEKWLTEASRLEKFCARWYVQPNDVKPLLGNVGAQLWQMLINDHDPEAVVREMDATVEAGSARKPNKQREVENINAMLPQLLPLLSHHADQTGDCGPMNAAIKHWGEAIDEDVSGFMMQGRPPGGAPKPAAPPPPPDPNEQMAKQQEIQGKLQEQQMKLQGQQMDLVGKDMDMKAKQQELQHEQIKFQMDLAAEQQQARLKLQTEGLSAFAKLQQSSMQHEQKMQHTGQMNDQKLRFERSKPKPQPAGKA